VRPRAAYAIPRVLVDLTTTFERIDEPPAGITRVETRLAEALLRCDDLCTVPVVFKYPGVLSALSMETALELLEISKKQPEIPLVLEGAKGARVLCDERPTPPKPTRTRLSSAMVMARAVSRQPGKVLRREKTLDEIVDMYERRHSVGVKTVSLKDKLRTNLTTRVHPTGADIFWTAGLLSHFVRPRPLHDLKSRTGLRVSCVLYDIIRVLYPEYNTKTLGADLHDINVADMLKLSEYPYAISDWSRSTIAAFPAERGIDHPPIALQAMGVDMPSGSLSEKTRAALHDLLGDRPFALCVGSVEPRKNTEMLLQAWEAMAATTPDVPTLVIVGRPSFGYDDLVKRIKAHPMFGTKVLWLSGCSDAALEHLYGAARVVLCPSFAEGWGLPVIEALAHGRPVVASNVTAHPEAAEDAAILLPPDAPEAWARAIRGIFAQPPTAAAPYRRPTWDQAGAALCDSLKQHLHDATGH
jgi:glycosyltransferase involved in cell wall biosynthesis